MEMEEILEFESEITRKLKASFKAHPERSPEPYYHLLMAPYLDQHYQERKNEGSIVSKSQHR